MAALGARSASRLAWLAAAIQEQAASGRSQDAVLAQATGEEQVPMGQLRGIVEQLKARERGGAQTERNAVLETLRISRLGIHAAVAVGGLALMLLLRQSYTLNDARRRHSQAVVREREQLEAAVRRRTDDLTALTRHLQTVREDECKHLARNELGELGALLMAAKLHLTRLRRRLATAPVEAHERLAHLNAGVDSGIALKRRIIDDLRPLALTNLGLAAAIEVQARQFAERTSVVVHTKLEDVALSESAEVTVCRLFQER
jgi:signal transduction histidine kinase